jgi:hypothetical protein
MKTRSWRIVSLWVIVFLLSRLFVLTHPPYVMPQPEIQKPGSGFSDVKQDYERYANMWHYGLTPYLKHWYEYPPAALIFTYLPLWVDVQGFGYYYLNYRVQIFLVEAVFFGFLLAFLYRLPITQTSRRLALWFYILIGVIAKDFWYDGLDLVFVMSLAGALLWRYKLGYDGLWKRVGFWSLFWLSVAIKLLTLPLALPFMVVRGLKGWSKEIVAMGLGFILVFGVPLTIFRSSLSVFLVFHGERPLKYEAFGSFIIRTINDFTGTEVRSDLAPHFPMVGPVSMVMERVTGITFPIMLMMVLLYYSYRFILRPQLEESSTAILSRLLKVSLMYFIVLFLSSKILSRPFHLWYIPLIVMYPFKHAKQQLLAMGLALLMVVLDTTPWITVPDIRLGGVLALDRIRDGFRFGPMICFLALIPAWKTRA